jgi:hypothetical protein
MLRSSVVAAKREFFLTLYMGERRVECTGIYDTGCLLTMPGTGEPVSIASASLIRELTGGGEESGTAEEGCAGVRNIPYSALGTDRGMLPVYRLDRMEIHRKKGVKVLVKPWVGQAQEALFGGKPYRVILNVGVIDNE